MTAVPDDIKLKTARTLKWNTIDKVASQVLYAVTGIVLANVVSKADFGLVGAMLVFQAFASLFVDSGFSSALIQKKNPDETDYCTVFYFNLAMSVAIYIVLWFSAPFIALLFGDERITDLSRVMFLTFILNATAIVQTNRLMKQMTVKMVAVSNTAALVVSGIAGIALAINGFGAWAIVWQSVILAAVKSAILWTTSKWVPRSHFSYAALKSIFKVGAGVMGTSFLNTVSLNVYNFIIGIFYNMSSLGVYTQADKWSKMGIASLSQILTASFLPVLSQFQDDKERLNAAIAKTNRFTAYVMMPCFLILIVSSQSIFHLFFGTKWDEAVPLFQILLFRGMFTVLTTLYNNYILAVGKAALLVYSETVKDVLLIAAILITVQHGILAMVIGQLVCGAIYFVFMLITASRALEYGAWKLLRDIMPYSLIAMMAIIIPTMATHYISNNFLLLSVQLLAGFGIYFLACMLAGSKIQHDVFSYALGRFRR